MKKLNNKGWGLVSFSIFIGMLFIALFVVVLLVNYFGTGLKRNDSSIIYDDNTGVIETLNYQGYESTLIDYARTYVNNNNIVLNEGEVRRLPISILGVPGARYNHCNGYVNVSRTGDLTTYQSYIDCGDYKTIGYQQ